MSISVQSASVSRPSVSRPSEAGAGDGGDGERIEMSNVGNNNVFGLWHPLPVHSKTAKKSTKPDRAKRFFKRIPPLFDRTLQSVPPVCVSVIL
jgi:hypothetical protein